MHRVHTLRGDRCGASTRKQPLVHEVKAAPLALHHFRSLKDPGEAVVPSPARVQDVPWRSRRAEGARG